MKQVSDDTMMKLPNYLNPAGYRSTPISQSRFRPNGAILPSEDEAYDAIFFKFPINELTEFTRNFFQNFR